MPKVKSKLLLQHYYRPMFIELKKLSPMQRGIVFTVSYIHELLNNKKDGKNYGIDHAAKDC